MKVSAQQALLGGIALLGLFLGYVLIFCFYAAGLGGDGTNISAAAWETILRRTIVLGPVLGTFMVLAFLSWRGRWFTTVAPWTFGAIAVVLIARRDAGILTVVDSLWIVIFVGIVLGARRPPEEADDEGPPE